MTLKEFKVWGGKREENDSLYIWAKDADDAIGIARLTDQSICISQWTGNEKSYEEALEQEPCEDAISRQSMLDYIKYLHGEMPEEEFVKALPSVTPTHKKGKWVDKEKISFPICSKCGLTSIEKYSFCPNCGAEMEGEEESE